MRDLRCRPGDLARVIQSINPALRGRIVIVNQLHDDARWEVAVLGDPVFGVADDAGPILTNDYLFSDSSLEPLRGDAVDHEIEFREVDHA